MNGCSPLDRVTIRLATVLDAPAIGACHDTCWRQAYRGLVSEELLDRAGASLADAPRHEVDIRGRQGRMAVRAVARADVLTTLSS